MNTWYLIVAILSGNFGGYTSHPQKTDVHMERGFVSEEACMKALQRYKALEQFSRTNRGIRVDARCLPG